jgi:hypothetical protein
VIVRPSRSVQHVLELTGTDSYLLGRSDAIW